MATVKTDEQKAIKALLEHRLTSKDRKEAKMEMLSFVDGSHHLWNAKKTHTMLPPQSAARSTSGTYFETTPIISEAYKQTMRAFLAHFFDACLRKSSVTEQEYDVMNVSPYLDSDHPSTEFDFRGGSIGNFVFTGARYIRLITTFIKIAE